MTSGLIDIQITGDSRDVEMRLMGMQRAFESERVAAWLVAAVDPYLRAKIDYSFGKETDPEGEPWLPLSPATVAIRQGKHFSGQHPINVRTGQMKRHLLDTPPRIAITTLGATMWSPGDTGSPETAKKVKTAQLGGQTPEGRNVPARPVLGVGPEDLETILIYLAIHIASYQPGVGAGASMIPIGFE